MSDGIWITQQSKIIADLFRISYSYLRRAVHVKSKVKELNPFPPPLPGLGTVNLTFSERRYSEGRYHKRSFFYSQIFSHISEARLIWEKTVEAYGQVLSAYRLAVDFRCSVHGRNDGATPIGGEGWGSPYLVDPYLFPMTRAEDHLQESQIPFVAMKCLGGFDNKIPGRLPLKDKAVECPCSTYEHSKRGHYVSYN